jgi:hypothetical protein
MIEKVECKSKDCTAMILPSTAERTGGICMQCKQKAERLEHEKYVLENRKVVDAIMTEYFEIIPGESIGPFKLGMTREQIEELDIRPRLDLNKERTVYPLVDIDVKEIKRGGFPNPGVHVYYDTSGTCHELEAIFLYDLSPPVFTLCGYVTNGMLGCEVNSILRSIASDVDEAWIYSPSAGIRAGKWELGIDEPIMSITVMPKEEKTSHAG